MCWHVPRVEALLQCGSASSFGHGVHVCIGAQLTRVEVKLALEASLSRVKRFTRLPGGIAWNMSLATHGPAVLPLRFEA